MNKKVNLKNKFIISLSIVLGILLISCINIIYGAASMVVTSGGESTVVYTPGSNIVDLVTNYGFYGSEGVVGNNVFLSCFEHITQKRNGYFYPQFCSGHGVRISSSYGSVDYSTGVPVGYIDTSVRREDSTDQGRHLAVLYSAQFNTGTTIGKGDEEYVVTVVETSEKEQKPSAEAGLSQALALGRGIWGENIQTITFGYYTNAGPENATPAEAYVLTEMDQNLDNYSYVQIAWWRVKTESNSSAGEPTGDGNEGIVEGGGNYDENDTNPDNIYRPPEDTNITDKGIALYEEAMAFQGYILEVAGETNGAAMKNRYRGQVFDINYADVVEEIDTSDIDVLYDSKTNTYRIGPMSVNYIRAGAKYGVRKAVDFAGISKAKLTVKDVDGSTRELKLDQSYYNGSKGFRIVYDHERVMKYYDVNDYSEYVKDQNFYYPYPYPDEEFYIEIDYMDDIASVEEFKFDFHWTNGGAQYENLMTASAYIINWEVNAEYKETVGHQDDYCSQHRYVHEYNSDGDHSGCHWEGKDNCHEHEHVSWTHTYYTWAQYKSHTTIQSQPFSCGLYATIVDFDPNYGDGTPTVGGGDAVAVTAGGWDLTTEIAGFAWVEGIAYEKGVVVSEGDSKWSEDVGEHGEQDKRKKNIEVRVMRVVYDKNGDSYTEVRRELAHAYKTKTIEEDGTITLTDEYDWGNTKLYTDDNGEYKVYLKIPSVEDKTENQMVSYDIEFIYDGQTYEAVEYLVSTEADNAEDKLAIFQQVSEDSKTSGTLDYSKFKDDSYVIENTSTSDTNTPVASGRNEIPLGRPNFDLNYEEVYGANPISDDKSTIGAANGDEGEKQLKYDGKMYSEFLEEVGDTGGGLSGEEDRIVSELDTEDDNEYVYEQYQLASRTSTASLLLPYTDRIYIRHYSDETATDDLKEYAQLYESQGRVLDGEESWYFPVYEYFHQINLGLIDREDVDLSVSKDLYKSEVVVNQQEVTYKYSTLRDYENEDNAEYLNTLLEIQNIHQKYELGLYAADFYYRSNVYEEAGTQVGDMIKEWKDGTELKMYVTYKMSVYNDSETAKVSVNEIIDFHDSSFTLVQEDEYADVIDTEGHKYSKLVAEAPYYRIYSLMESELTSSIYHYNSKEDIAEDSLSRAEASGQQVIQETIPSGSWVIDTQTYGDGAYKKATLDMFNHDSGNEGFKLSPGEKIELFVTYEIDKEGYEDATKESYSSASEKTREKLLGGKNNVIEVGNYTTFYTKEGIRFNTSAYKEGDISGQVDADSAPDNINFNKTVKDEDGDVTLDKKWFDDDADSAPVYRIYIREGDEERRIDGTVWEDKDSSDAEGFDTATADGIRQDSEPLIEGVTVSLVEKIRIPKDPESSGDDENNPYLEYEFVWPENISSVMEGYNPITRTDQNGGYGFRNFTSGVYVVRFEYGNTVETIEYNGQDYENTAYQTGMTNKTSSDETEQENCDSLYQLGEATLNNEWHDLGKNEAAKELEEAKVSDARDYEPQRLRVIAYSRTINNSVAEILATNERNNGKQQELMDATAMVANTAKLNFEVERSSEIDYEKYNNDDQSIKVVKGVSKEQIENIEDTQQETQKYYAKGIDFGIEDRAQNSIQLDKYLKQIELTKENGNEVILRVDIDDNEAIIYDSENTVNPSRILALSQSGGVQGFKYITMESDYFNDLTVTLTYRMDVVNESEVDWTSENLSKVYTFEELNDLADEIEGTVDPSASTSEYTAIAKGEGISYGEYAGYYYYTNEVIDKNTKQATVPKKSEADIEYKDAVVKTTVDMLVDYIDPDISLAESSASFAEEGAWENSFNYENFVTTERVRTLEGLISEDSYTVDQGNIYLQDNNGNLYISESKSNIAISANDAIERKDRPYIKYERKASGAKQVDSTGWDFVKSEQNVPYSYSYKVESSKGSIDSIYNRTLTKELEPIGYSGEEKAKGEIFIDTSVTVNSSNSADNMNYDNLAEVLVYSNTVGRRTFMENEFDSEEHKTIASPSDKNIPTIPGNANEIAKLENSNATSQGGGIWNAGHTSNLAKTSKTNLAEIDGDATEYVTFTEPTGIKYVEAQKAKYMIIVLSIMGVLSLGVVGVTVKLVIDKRKLLGEE